MRIHLPLALVVGGVVGFAACNTSFLQALIYQGRTSSGERLANGQQTGHWKYWYDTGRARLKSEGDYEADKHVGTWTFWHENGAKSFEATLDDGAYEGTATSWYANGQMHARGAYKAGVKDGPWTFWREDGTKEQEGPFVKGAREGRWTYYDARGVAQAEAPFKNDDRIAVTASPTPPKPVDPPPVEPKPKPAPTPPVTTPVAPVTPPPTPVTPPVLPATVEPPPVPKTGIVAPPMTTLQSGEAAKDPDVKGPAGFSVDQLAAIYSTGKSSAASPASGPAPDSYAVGDARNPPTQPKRNEGKSEAIEGRPLPYTRVVDHTGKPLDLKQFQGKSKVLIIILRGMKGSMCEYCCGQTMALEARMADIKRTGTEVVILYPGEEETLSIFLQNVQTYYKAQYGTEAKSECILACDPAMKLIDGLGLRDLLAKPTSLIIGKNGIVEHAFVGRDKQDRLCVDLLVKELAKLP